MRNQKGISLMKLIIIVAIIIVGIVFIVAMSKPQNGIGSLKEETEEWEKSRNNADNAKQKVNELESKYYNSK